LPKPDSDHAGGHATVSLAWALLAVALLVSWQFLTVHYNWQNNWTALFCTGDHAAVPPELASTTYRFANSAGYDGQMYRYVAHDPLAEREVQYYLDAPVIRYRRMLVPALAFLLVAGRQQLIDFSYIAVIAVLVFTGTYWLSRWIALQGLHPAWGLAFLLTPATMTSMDRMTVDVAVAAFTVGLGYYAAIGATAKVYSLLVLACLARETGALLLFAVCICELWSKRRARAIIYATAAIPMLAWYLYLRIHIPASGSGIPRWFRPRLAWGILARIAAPRHYPLPAAIETITRLLDVLALIGIVGALAATGFLLATRRLDLLTIAAALFAVLAVVLTSPTYWNDAFEYARVFTPLLVLVALIAVAERDGTPQWWWMLVPAILVDLRVGLQLGPQVLGIFHGLSGR